MLNGLYSAAQGMLAQQARMDALANDIANVNTTGYKSVRVAFRELVPTPGAPGAGAATVELGRSLAQGVLMPSSNPLSVAIEGPGYIRVKRPDGSTVLTRAGDLRVDAKGDLVLATGERLEPRITFPEGTSPGDVEIAADGTVSVRGQKLGTIEVVTVPAPAGLLSVGDGLYAVTAASGDSAAAKGSLLHQGVVEASNVDLGTAMVDVIGAQRAFELASRAVRVQDQLMEIANQLRR
jgi:flagellar basal-body rod protein FlgG